MHWWIMHSETMDISKKKKKKKDVNTIKFHVVFNIACELAHPVADILVLYL